MWRRLLSLQQSDFSQAGTNSIITVVIGLIIEAVRRALIALMMEAVRTSETSVYFNNTLLCYTSEGYHIHLIFC
jgi:hypothetical protein